MMKLKINMKYFDKLAFIVSQHMAVHHGAFDVGGDCIRLLVVNQFTVNLVFLSLSLLFKIQVIVRTYFHLQKATLTPLYIESITARVRFIAGYTTLHYSLACLSNREVTDFYNSQGLEGLQSFSWRRTFLDMAPAWD